MWFEVVKTGIWVKVPNGYFESDLKWFRLQKFLVIFGQILKFPTILPDRIMRTQLKLDHFYFWIFFCTIVGLTVRPNQKSKQYPIYPTTFRHLWKTSNYQNNIGEKNFFYKLNQDFSERYVWTFYQRPK